MNGVELLLMALAASLVAALALGAKAAAARSGLSSAPIPAATFVAAAWLGLTTALAQSGLLADWGSRPPRVGWLPLGAMALLMGSSFTPYVRRLIAHTPATWPLALQSFRIVVETVLFWLWQEGRAPIQVTFEGRNFDMLAGLSAPIVATIVAAHGLRSWAIPLVLTWNLLGLGLLANIMFTAATSVPGPMQIAWPGGAFEALASWPVVWIPAFLAPVAVFLHVVSIRQALAARERGLKENLA